MAFGGSSSGGSLPSVARLLAAGQKGEALEGVTPSYGPCKAASVAGKGRGLVAAAHVPVNGSLVLEPALASGGTYSELAHALQALVDAPGGGGDGVLMQQLLSLSCWGQAPDSVPPVPSEGSTEAQGYMRRRPPSSIPGEENEAALKEARRLLDEQEAVVAVEGSEEAHFQARLLRRLELIAQGNAFGSAIDVLGALAWQTLTPDEQRNVAEVDPRKMPVPRKWLFLWASLINHSETPNASWLLAGSVILVRAARPIEPGEEITVSYWPDVDVADAAGQGLLERFSMTPSSLGGAEELALSAEQQEALKALKAAPLAVATCLGAAGTAQGGDPAAVFDQAAAALTTSLSAAEAVLPKHLKAFLEPRFVQAQLTLQQSAILTARGDAANGEKLWRLAELRMRMALKQYAQPWGKRVLLRLLFALKGILRPAPAETLAGAAAAGEDFSIRLARQACLSPDVFRSELEGAVEAVFGDANLLPAVLAKCGLGDPAAVSAE